MQQDFHQHEREKDRERIVGAGFDLDRGGDARAQPQAARMHQEEHGGGVGRGHRRAQQQAFEPAEAEAKTAAGAISAEVTRTPIVASMPAGASTLRKVAKPGTQAAVEQDQRQRDRADGISESHIVEARCRPGRIRPPACRPG